VLGAKKKGKAEVRRGLSVCEERWDGEGAARKKSRVCSVGDVVIRACHVLHVHCARRSARGGRKDSMSSRSSGVCRAWMEGAELGIVVGRGQV
jgi:hypothetical protein